MTFPLSTAVHRPTGGATRITATTMGQTILLIQVRLSLLEIHQPTLVFSLRSRQQRVRLR